MSRKDEYKAYVNFSGVTVNITTNNADYMRYLSNHFGDMLNESGFYGKPDIESNLNWMFDTWGNKSISLPSGSDFVKLGGSVVMSQDELIWVKKLGSRRLRIGFSIDKDSGSIFLNGIFHKKVLKDNFKKYISGKNEEQTFFELTYYFVYYPIFYALKKQFRIFPMHAGCVKTSKGAVVMAGFEGVGKSTLSLLLSKEPDCSFVSDNLVLYDTENVCAVPEPVRLHKDTVVKFNELLYRINKDKQLKDFYGVKRRELDWIKPSSLLLLSFSDDFSFTEITSRDAASFILSVNNLVGELRGYHEFSSVFNLLWPGDDFEISESDILERFTSKVKCYLLCIDKKMPKEEFVRLVKEKIDNAVD